MTNLPAHPDDQEPVIVHGGLPLYRLVNGSLVRDDLRGDLVKLQDARLRYNDLQSQLVSLGLGQLTREEKQQHQHRGDLQRLWQIFGSNKQGNTWRDIFQHAQALMERNAAMQRELEEARRVVKAESFKGLAIEYVDPDPSKIGRQVTIEDFLPHDQAEQGD